MLILAKRAWSAQKRLARSVQTEIASIKEGALSQKGGASLFEGERTKTEGDAAPHYDALAKALCTLKICLQATGDLNFGNTLIRINT